MTAGCSPRWVAGWSTGATIVTFCVTGVLVAPYSSRAVSVTANVPGAVKVRIGTGPEPVPWFVPNVHEYVRVGAFSSVDVRASKVHTFVGESRRCT